MPKYFFIHTHLSDFEREMTGVPNFDNRGNKTLVDSSNGCQNCADKTLLTGGFCVGQIKCELCPCVLERLIGGTVYRWLALQSAKSGQLQMPTHIFMDTDHSDRFHKLCATLSYDIWNQKQVAVIYLISSTKQLFERTKGHQLEIALRSVNVRGLDCESYTLLCTAKDVLLKTSYTSPSDFENEEIIPDSIIGFVYCSLLIQRFGIQKNSPLRRFLR